MNHQSSAENSDKANKINRTLVVLVIVLLAAVIVLSALLFWVVSNPAAQMISPDDTQTDNDEQMHDQSEGMSDDIEKWDHLDARLDRSHERTGCHPFYPVDIYAVYPDNDEVLIYDDLNVCDPSGRPVEGKINEPNLFSGEEFKINDELVGEVLSYSVGDAGYSATISVYFPYANPTQNTRVLNGSGDGQSTLYITRNGVERRVTIQPEAYEVGRCEDKQIRLLVDGELAWVLSEHNTEYVCEDTTFKRGGVERSQIQYTELFDYVQPTDIDLSTFKFYWGGLWFEFDVEDPINTFDLIGFG